MVFLSLHEKNHSEDILVYILLLSFEKKKHFAEYNPVGIFQVLNSVYIATPFS